MNYKNAELLAQSRVLILPVLPIPFYIPTFIELWLEFQTLQSDHLDLSSVSSTYYPETLHTLSTAIK